MIDDVRLEHDSDGTVESWTLVLEDDFGSHRFDVDPEMLLAALRPWVHAQIEGELVRRRRQKAGGVSWDGFRRSQARTDPEWSDELAAAADHFRKFGREHRAGAMVDPGDHSRAA